MKKLLTLLLFTAVTGAVYSASDWERAVEVYSDFSDLKPYTMQVYSETFDRKGNLEKTEKQIFSMIYDDNEDPTQVLLQAFENGIDITEEKKRELERGEGRRSRRNNSGENMEGMNRHPFDPEVQHDVKAVSTGKTDYKKGILCSVWEFSLRLDDKYTGIGTAWINTKTGEPVSIEYTIAPLFPFVEEMNIGMEFITDENLNRVLSKLSMEGRVNMVLTKRSFESVTSFSNYR